MHRRNAERYEVDYLDSISEPKIRMSMSIELSDRVEYELGIIGKTGFNDYFLIVADFMRWARDEGIPVGPGRGSGAGCLVAYLLGITDIDPLRFGLLFERFLNPERVSPPDFDIDFCMREGGEVIEYVRKVRQGLRGQYHNLWNLWSEDGYAGCRPGTGFALCRSR